MNARRIGVAAMTTPGGQGGDANATVERIVEYERRGIPVAWLTTGGSGLDALTTFAAAAARTERIRLGTCIVPTWPRHPIVTVQQMQVLTQLAPGRMVLGLGPSHKPGMTDMFGVDFRLPLTNLKEYVHVVKSLMRDGSVDFQGTIYHAKASIPQTAEDMPIMASALRLGSYEYCGEETDGAISWVSPYKFLAEEALPAMQKGARKAGRETPPLVAHVPMCVHDNRDEVRAAAKAQLVHYPRLPFYVKMLVASGYPEAQSNTWSDDMIDAVVVSGNEVQVAERLKGIFDSGISEIIVTFVTAGDSPDRSRDRTVDLMGNLAGKI